MKRHILFNTCWLRTRLSWDLEARPYVTSSQPLAYVRPHDGYTKLHNLVVEILNDVPQYTVIKYNQPRLSRIQVDWGILSELRENPT